MTTVPTLIHVILDRSGSMNAIRNAMIEAFNGFVAEQRKVPGKTRWTLTLFDAHGKGIDVKTVFSDVKGRNVPKLGSDKAPFEPRGMTPLYDAVGQTVADIKAAKGQQVVVVVITDGFENASREWTPDKLKQMIGKKTKANWQFVFLGADQDAALTGAAMGMQNTMSYAATDVGTRAVGQTMSSAVSTYRSTGKATEGDQDLRDEK